MRFIKDIILPVKSFLIFVAFAAIISIHGFFAESALTHPGYGPDATIYASWVRNTPAFLNQTVNPYHFQKTFPAVAVNGLMRGLKLDLNEANIKFAFTLFSNLTLIGALYIILLIFKDLKFTFRQQLLGVSFLVFTKLYLLIPHWNPVSVDPTAMFLSVFIVWAYLRNYLLILTGVIFLASFTWPSLLILSAFLYVFPTKKYLKPSSLKLPKNIESLIKKVLQLTPIIASTLIVGLTTYLFYSKEYLEWAKPAEMNVYTPVLEGGIFFISLFIMGGFIFLIYKHTLNNDLVLDYLRNLNVKQTVIRLGIYAVLFVSVKFLIGIFSSAEPPVVSFKRIISTTLIFGATYPGTFITNHIMYYGPVLILCLFFYKHIIKHLIEHAGIGLLGGILIGVIFGLNSETRYFFNTVQLLVIFCIPILTTKLHKNSVIILVVIQFIFSFSWLPIISNSTTEWLTTKYHTINGPWMTYTQLSIYNLIILSSILLIAVTEIYHRKQQKKLIEV